MCISGIVHLLHQTLGDFPVYIDSLWQLYCTRSHVAVHTHTVGVLKYRLLPMEVSSAMRVSGIVQLLNQALGNFLVYVFILWHPYCIRHREADKYKQRVY